jgi:hypothetical protein
METLFTYLQCYPNRTDKKENELQRNGGFVVVTKISLWLGTVESYLPEDLLVLGLESCKILISLSEN